MKSKCDLCPHGCSLEDGQTGFCRARTARDGTVVSANYGLITSLALDPIEKKPLAMFMPGKMILSLGSYGCNLRCPWCQNHDISQAGSFPGAEFISPEEAVETALRLRNRGNVGIAFTYNEPLISREYVEETAALAHESGLKNVLVSNGNVNTDSAQGVISLMDAMNIDLKVFSHEEYRKIGGNLDSVLAFIEASHSAGVHVELTTLIIPGINDDEEMMEKESEYIASVDPGIPLHVTRFFPRFQMTDRGATPVETVYNMAGIAKKYLNNVFVGNV